MKFYLKTGSSSALIIGAVLIIMLACFFTSCSSIPENVIPVSNFDSEKYLGTWYEIARFDFKFEKNMSNVQANYSMNKDGSIKVINSGYDYVKGVQKEKTGRAKFAGAKDKAALKVSFFGPFYSGYNVIAIDEYYQYSLVAGNSYKYLWILSRTPTIPDNVKEDYIRIATQAGYDLTNLVWTEQN